MEVRPAGGPQGETGGFGAPDSMTGTNTLPRSIASNNGRPQSAPGTAVTTGFGYDSTGRPVSPYGYDANGQPLNGPDPNAPFGYGSDGQPIRGPNPNAPFGYGPDGEPLTALDPRAPNGYGPDGKPLPGLACVAPYGLDRNGKPLGAPDPNAPFGYHPSDGMPVATNDPTAPFGFGPDGNPLQSRDPNAPFGYNQDGQPNSLPERVAFCDEDVEAILNSSYNNPPMAMAGRGVSPFGGPVAAGQGGLADMVNRIEQRDEQVGANWPLYADGSGGVPADGFPNGAQYPAGSFPGAMYPNGLPPGTFPAGAQMFQNGMPSGAFPNGMPPGSYPNGVPPGAFQNGNVPFSGANSGFSQDGSYMDPNANAGAGGSFIFVGGPGTNMIISYDPQRVNNAQAPLLHMANAASCGMEIGGSVGMLDCAATMRVAMECMLTRVTSVLTGVLMQNVNTNAPPAGGNRIGLTEFITNPSITPGAAAPTASSGDARGFTYPVAGDEDTSQGPDTVGDEAGAGEGPVSLSATSTATSQPRSATATVTGSQPQSATATAAGSQPQSTTATAAGSKPQSATASAAGSKPQSTTATAAGSKPQSATATAAGSQARSATATVTGSQPPSVTASVAASQPHSQASRAVTPESAATGATAVGSTVISKPASAQLPTEDEEEANTGTQPTSSQADMAPDAQGPESASKVPSSSTQPAASATNASMASTRSAQPSQKETAASLATASVHSTQKEPSSTVQKTASTATVKSTAPPVPSVPRPAVRRRCIPDELKQFVPGAGPGVCAHLTGAGRTAASCPPIPPRRLRLESLLVTKDSRQLRMGEYIGDILSRATDRIMQSRKDGEGIPAALMRGAAEAVCDGAGAPGGSAASSLHEPSTCTTGALRESLDGKNVGAFLKEVAPQYQTVLDSSLSPDDQTTLTLLTTVGTLLDTIEDTGLTRMDPVQLCSDNTLKSLVDVGEKMMTGLRDHLAKIKANPPSNPDPLMNQITREAQDALEIGAESLEVAVGLLKDVVNLCGEMAEHPELLEKCEADISEARKRTEDQMEAIKSKEIKTCSKETSVEDGGLTTTDTSCIDSTVCGAEDGEPCVDEESGMAAQEFKDEAEGNETKVTDAEAESDGVEAGEVGAAGMESGGDETTLADASAETSAPAETKSKVVSATASKIAGNAAEVLTGAESGGSGTAAATYRTESGRVVAQTPSGRVVPVAQTKSGKFVTQTPSGRVVPVSAPNSGIGVTQTSSGRIVDADGRKVIGQTPSGKVVTKTESGRTVAKTKSGRVVSVDSKTEAKMGRGIFGGGMSQAVQSYDSTQTTATTGRIVIFSVSFVVGVVVGYVLARTFGLFGLGSSSGGSGRLSGLFWGPSSDRPAIPCGAPRIANPTCPIPKHTGGCGASAHIGHKPGCGY